MSIIKNLEKVQVAVVLDTFKQGNFARLLSSAAVSALLKGINSTEWNKYMSLFADNAEQLRLLTVEDEDEPSWFRESRAYIVSNGVCGAGTTGHTKLNVLPEFGEGLPDDPDGTIEKPFPIPYPKNA